MYRQFGTACDISCHIWTVGIIKFRRQRSKIEQDSQSKVQDSGCCVGQKQSAWLQKGETVCLRATFPPKSPPSQTPLPVPYKSIIKNPHISSLTHRKTMGKMTIVFIICSFLSCIEPKFSTVNKTVCLPVLSSQILLKPMNRQCICTFSQ